MVDQSGGRRRFLCPQPIPTPRHANPIPGPRLSRFALAESDQHSAATIAEPRVTATAFPIPLCLDDNQLLPAKSNSIRLSLYVSQSSLLARRARFVAARKLPAHPLYATLLLEAKKKKIKQVRYEG